MITYLVALLVLALNASSGALKHPITIEQPDGSTRVDVREPLSGEFDAALLKRRTLIAVVNPLTGTQKDRALWWVQPPIDHDRAHGRYSAERIYFGEHGAHHSYRFRLCVIAVNRPIQEGTVRRSMPKGIVHRCVVVQRAEKPQ